MTYEEAIEKLSLMSRSTIAELSPQEAGELAGLLRRLGAALRLSGTQDLPAAREREAEPMPGNIP